ncbi:MAG: transposase [SAR324 cluster bacterium]|jgi:transposase-like protein
MVPSTNQLQTELLQIELAIELDQGKSVSEVAELFGVTIAVVNAVAKKSGSAERNIRKIKTRRFSDAEKTVLVERIATGEALEDIAAEVGITEITIRRWCKKHGVSVPRGIGQISLAEQHEIRELLEENDPHEIAQAYNISRETVEELQEPLHSILDAETLSYLFELLRERPRSSDKILCGIAKEAGLQIPESAVGSYRKRLKILDLI